MRIESACAAATDLITGKAGAEEGGRGAGVRLEGAARK